MEEIELRLCQFCKHLQLGQFECNIFFSFLVVLSSGLFCSCSTVFRNLVNILLFARIRFIAFSHKLCRNGFPRNPSAKGNSIQQSFNFNNSKRKVLVTPFPLHDVLLLALCNAYFHKCRASNEKNIANFFGSRLYVSSGLPMTFRIYPNHTHILYIFRCYTWFGLKCQSKQRRKNVTVAKSSIRKISGVNKVSRRMM